MKIVEREIPATFVPPMGTVKVLLHAGDVPLRPYSLRLDDEAARSLLITDFWCGRDSYLISLGAIPACVFSEKALMEEIYFGWVPPDPSPGEVYTVHDIERKERLRGCGFVLGVTNTSLMGQTFGGHVLCWQDRGLPLDRFRTVVGLGCTRIPGRQACHVNVMPQFDFSPDRLVIPSTIGDRVVVDMVRILERSTRFLVGNTAGVECGCVFSERLEGRVLLSGCKQTRPGDTLTVSVRNVIDEPLDFCGAFFGEARAL